MHLTQGAATGSMVAEWTIYPRTLPSGHRKRKRYSQQPSSGRVRATLFQCSGCNCQTSVTAGTVFQETRKPLSVWFRAMWFVTSQKNGASALGLQQVLTAKRVWERLNAEHGFGGGYTVVKDYVRQARLRHKEMFVPLTHPLGGCAGRFR
jgi:hypothetical protein